MEKELSIYSVATDKSTKLTVAYDIYIDSAWCYRPNNAIFMCGGSQFSNSSALKKAGEVLLADNTYIRLSDMQSSRSYHGAIALGTNIYVMGGNDEFKVSQSSFESYNMT